MIPFNIICPDYMRLPSNSTKKQKEIYIKNLLLYNYAHKKILAKYGVMEMIALSDLSVQDLWITFDINRFINIYPYRQEWIDYSNGKI